MDPVLHWIWQIGLSVLGAVLSILLSTNIYWIKKWMRQREDWENKHDGKENGLDEEGGVVTRDKFFGFCQNCHMVGLLNPLKAGWETLLSKGGAMTREEVLERMDASADRLLEGVKNLLEAHQNSADANFKAIRAEIEGNAQKLNLVAARQGEVVLRIDKHLDSHAKMHGGE